MDKTGNIESSKTPCVVCGCNSAVITDGDPLCFDCARIKGTKSASVDKCAGSCKTLNELVEKHKD